MSAATPRATPASLAAGLLGAAGVLLTGTLALQQPLPPAPSNAAQAVPVASRSCPVQPDGYLRGRFFGALSLSADWAGARLACEGMQRPDGLGVRLYFAGSPPGGGQVALLIGLEGRPQDLPGPERPASVTVIDERDGRFFSTRGAGRCWSSIKAVTALSGRSGTESPGYRIEGLVYCVGALPSLGDRSSLTLSELQFAGRIDADAI